jgi:hypothetical protein
MSCTISRAHQAQQHQHSHNVDHAFALWLNATAAHGLDEYEQDAPARLTRELAAG